MTHPAFIVEPLGAAHERAGFSCGNDVLDRYLKEQASQDLRRGCATPFVLIRGAGANAVLGYYTLSSYGIDVGELPPSIAKKLPRYPLIPGTLLGRIAIDQKYQGKGIGEFLLLDALHRSLLQSAHIASAAIVVEALDEHAARFYQHFGFVPFPAIASRLFVPMKTVKELLD